MAKKQGLSAKKLLKGVYNAFKKNGRKIKLLSKATVEISNDSDWHRTQIAYTGYESAILLKIGDKEWAVAFGTACGSYSAYLYNCDIVAVQLSSNGKSNKQIAIEIHDALKQNDYFRNSLIYAMADGRLAVNKNGHLGQKVFDLLGLKIHKFIAQDLKTDSDFFTLDLRPMVKSAVQYKTKFVIFLYDAFRTILAS